PFAAEPQLLVVLTEQRGRHLEFERRTARIVPWVFHVGGQPMTDYRMTWEKACREAGCPGMWQHDMRRTTARRLILNGMAPQVVMRLLGHKTMSMLDRYL